MDTDYLIIEKSIEKLSNLRELTVYAGVHDNQRESKHYMNL
jgi:hypothetical protein